MSGRVRERHLFSVDRHLISPPFFLSTEMSQDAGHAPNIYRLALAALR